ncbi:hypothetical protein PsorP6_015427 [Peronosclerospora sorghi]|uniref:Uncharacterized protein n=1 Tax=Peronosclerospora sorghi TaxID=230839 RepID=A0ACC0WMW2_9STRA|nr:hypothetical protein PsorP6_015427 [Peronosclerospora sorghi]
MRKRFYSHYKHTDHHRKRRSVVWICRRNKAIVFFMFKWTQRNLRHREDRQKSQTMVENTEQKIPYTSGA